MSGCYPSCSSLVMLFLMLQFWLEQSCCCGFDVGLKFWLSPAGATTPLHVLLPMHEPRNLLGTWRNWEANLGTPGSSQQPFSIPFSAVQGWRGRRWKGFHDGNFPCPIEAVGAPVKLVRTPATGQVWAPPSSQLHCG